MTIKHIGFMDSVVMRAYQRVAVEKGLVTPDVKQYIEKAAAERVKETPTGHLLFDVGQLVNDLNDKGYYKEAKALADKLDLYKSAQDEVFSKMLEEARVEQKEVSKSKEDDGKVDGLVETHKKMRESAEKEAKAAEVVSLLKMAAHALNVKTAQELVTGDEDSFEDKSEESKNEQIQSQLNEINQKISSSFPSISDKISEIEENSHFFSKPNIESWFLTEEKVLNPVGKIFEFYCEKTGTPSKGENSLAHYISIVNLFYNKKEPSLQETLAKFNSPGSLGTVEQWCRSLLKNKADLYLSGSIPDSRKTEELKKYPDINNDPRLKDSDTAIRRWVRYDRNQGHIFTPVKENIQKLAEIFFNRVMLLKTRLISKEKLDKCNEIIAKSISPSIAIFNSLKSFFKSEFYFKAKDESLVSFATNLNKSSYALMNLASGNASKQLTVYAEILGASHDASAISQLTEELSSLVKDVLNTINSTLNSEQVGVDTFAAASIINSIKNVFENKIKILETTDPENKFLDSLKNDISLANNLLTILKSSRGLPWSRIKNTIAEAKLYTDLKDIKDLENRLAGWLDAINKLANEKNNISKLGQAPGGAMATAPSKPANSKPVNRPGSTSSAKPQGGGATKSKDYSNVSEDRKAVQLMQARLVRFGEAIQNNLLAELIKQNNKNPDFKYSQNDGVAMKQAVGAKANPVMLDGAWGEATDKWLGVANKYLAAAGFSDQLKTGTVYWNNSKNAHDNPEEVKKNAKENTAKLERVLYQVKGLSEEESKAVAVVYDSIDGVEVTSGDLASLASVYDLLFKLGWLQEQVNFSGGEPGASLAGFSEALQKLQFRAATLYNAYKGDKNKTEYLQKVVNLINILVKYVSAAKPAQNATVNKKTLQALFGTATSGVAGGQGNQGGAPGSASSDKNQYANHGNMDGRNVMNPDSMKGRDGEPIDLEDGSIDLSLRYYSEIYNRYKPQARILEYNVIRNANVESLAQMFSEHQTPYGTAVQKAFTQVGISRYGLTPAGDDILYVNPQSNRTEVLSANPQLMALVQRYRGYTPALTLREFLNELRNTLGVAVTEWAKDQNDKKLITTEEQMKLNWQDMLGKKIQEITRKM